MRKLPLQVITSTNLITVVALGNSFAQQPNHPVQDGYSVEDIAATVSPASFKNKIAFLVCVMLMLSLIEVFVPVSLDMQDEKVKAAITIILINLNMYQIQCASSVLVKDTKLI